MKGVLCTETALKLRRAARAAFVFDYRMLTCSSHESLFEAADSDGERPSVYSHLRRKIGPRMAHRALVTVSPAVLNHLCACGRRQQITQRQRGFWLAFTTSAFPYELQPIVRLAYHDEDLAPFARANGRGCQEVA